MRDAPALFRHLSEDEAGRRGFRDTAPVGVTFGDEGDRVFADDIRETTAPEGTSGKCCGDWFGCLDWNP